MSRLELRASGLDVHSPTTHQERVLLMSLGWALRNPGTVVYDIGAATGTYAVAFAKVSTVVEVIAFEPLGDSFSTLLDRTRQLENVRCLNLALGDESTQLDLNRSAWRDTSSFLAVSDVTRTEFPLAAEHDGVERVRVARLDDVVSEHRLPFPDVVKIDVQGFENRVLSGGERTVRSARVCIVEVSFRPLYEGSPLFEDVYPLMTELGFRLAGLGGSIMSSGGELLQVDAIFQPAESQVTL